MRIGIISEGVSDIAVITNVIKGITGLDSSDIVAIRPLMSKDKTHLANINPDNFSSWSVVRQECIERKKIKQFLSLEDSKFVVIHLDSAEAEQYNVEKPDIGHQNYCSNLRDSIIEKVNEWLEHEFTDELLYAIAIEEIDAWVLLIYDEKVSEKLPNPKERLNWILRKAGENSTVNYANYLRLSKNLSKNRLIEKHGYLKLNCSLRLFRKEVDQKINQSN